MTTRKEDAESIIGEELAENIEKQASLVGKSEALITRNEEEVPAETAPVEQPEPELDLKAVVAEMAKSLVELRSSLMEFMAKDKKEEKEDEMDEEEEDDDKKKMKEEKAEIVEEQPVPSIDLVQAFSEAVAPITQRLDILIAAQSKANVNVPQQIVPERRSISPSTIPQGVQQQPQGGPMKISDFVKRSVGLPQNQ